MDLLAQFLDIVLHLDKHLAIMVQQYGLWIYGILFFIIFAETGFVVTPFLPGDSLLFVAGALAAIGEGGPARLDAESVERIIRALRGLRLEDEARRIAAEAILAGAPS